MSLTFPDATTKKPSAITGLPSALKRPAFGTLYGFDASGVGSGGGVPDLTLLTEAGDFIVTELGAFLQFNIPPLLTTEAGHTLITENNISIST